MLGEEGNGLGTSFDAVEHVPDGGTFLDEVGLLELSEPVILQIFSGRDELLKLSEVGELVSVADHLNLGLLVVVVHVHE